MSSKKAASTGGFDGLLLLLFLSQIMSVRQGFFVPLDCPLAYP